MRGRPIAMGLMASAYAASLAASRVKAQRDAEDRLRQQKEADVRIPAAEEKRKRKQEKRARLEYVKG